jgi:hypothetical protein
MITEHFEVITTVERALELLVSKWGSSRAAEIDLVLKPVLIVRSYRGPHDSLSAEHHYEIDPAVVKQLKDRLLVTGVLRMGYVDDNVLRVTQLGEQLRWEKFNGTSSSSQAAAG